MWMSSSDIASLWDQFSRILGLFTGGLGGLFVLGIMSRQAHGKGAIVGLLASSVIQYFVSVYTDLHLFLYAGVGLVSCVVIGQLASLFINDPHNPEGRKLTVYNKLFGYRSREERSEVDAVV
jgi:SSS family solute:Na+ symporter